MCTALYVTDILMENAFPPKNASLYKMRCSDIQRHSYSYNWRCTRNSQNQNITKLFFAHWFYSLQILPKIQFVNPSTTVSTSYSVFRTTNRYRMSKSKLCSKQSVKLLISLVLHPWETYSTPVTLMFWLDALFPFCNFHNRCIAGPE